jgi:hypothetical protein
MLPRQEVVLRQLRRKAQFHIQDESVILKQAETAAFGV